MFTFSSTRTSAVLNGAYIDIGNGISGDFNGDGVLDIAFSTDISSASLEYTTPIAIYLRTPGTNRYDLFTPTIDNVTNSLPDAYFVRDLVAVDINYDGISDLIPIDATEKLTPVDADGGYVGAEQFAYISNGVGFF